MSITGITGFILTFLAFTAFSDDFPYPKDAPSEIKDCRNVIFNCDCGNPGYKMQAVIKQCHYWMPPEQACVRFQHCLECEDGEDRCTLCRPGRYGRWCGGECQCQNGGSCNRETGSCVCPEGYEGDHCESRAVITTGEINCQTKGSAVMGKSQVVVRITCPSGCQRDRNDIWGTSVYTEDSSVCRSAVHSGFIADNGGSAFVVNIGLYSNFAGSAENGITSKERKEPAKGFRFYQPSPDEDEKMTGCPPKWINSDDYCLLAKKPEEAWRNAQNC